MRTALLGVFRDYELAALARVELLSCGFPTHRINLTAVQGPGQSRFRATPTARDQFLTSLRILFKYDDDIEDAERLADRVERGAATVCVHTHSTVETKRVSAILRNFGATEIVRANSRAQIYDKAIANHEAAWPSYLWPAT